MTDALIRENGTLRAKSHPAALSDREQQAVALLYADGWHINELTMTFEVGEKAIRNAIQRGGER